MKRTHVAALVAVSTALFATACARPAPGPVREWAHTQATNAPAEGPVVTGLKAATVTHFAGRVVNGDFTAAIAVVGGTVVGYICDCRSADAWLTGQVAQEGLTELTNVRSTVSAAISVAIDDKQAVGTVTWHGNTFQISLPALGSEYGLYRAKQNGVSGGWIRLPGEPAAKSCGLVVAKDGPTASSPFTGTGSVDVPGYATLTPHRVDQI